jgi:hypothetical protein
MSSSLLKIIRSLKGNSSHQDHYEHYQGVNHGYNNHYNSNGKHLFSGLAFKAVRELSGKLFQNKRLLLLAIIAFLTISGILLVFAGWLVVMLIKMCGPLVSDIEKNGLKSVVDALTKIVTGIWQGTGK